MSKTLGVLLILSVTAVLLSLLFTGNQPLLVILAVMIVLIAMILVIGGAPGLLPSVLKIVLVEIRRILHP